MTKFILVLFSLVCTLAVAQPQQVRVNAYGGGQIAVNGYNGGTKSKILTVQMQISDPKPPNTTMDQWSLTYKVNGTISNGSKTFPPDKIKLRFNDVTHNGTNDANIIPTASSLMLNTGMLPLTYTNSFFAYNSTYNLTLLTKYYMGLTISYDAVVDSGAYLAQYSSGTAYTINVTVEIRDKNGVVRDSEVANFSMMIIPIYNNYGMIFDPAAQNILLEFNNTSAYVNGVSKTFTQAFSTVSTTGYTVKVSTLSNNLTSGNNNLLPVGAIKLTVRDNITQAIKGTVNLSSTKQTVITSAAHTTLFFDTTYSTLPGDVGFYNKPYGQYSGTLVFEMAPQ
ncbi:MAG: hypothetical protein K0M63_06340 [Weeksellaceae bacterium]|nr:hypothetical protein [Weeksellaceae bacterium]